MKALTCELCGSNDVVKQDGFFVCQHCGTKYSLEEAKKLIGTVKIDKSEETDKLLVLARRARNEGNSENAEKYYGMVLMEDPNNWEAFFFQVYYQAAQCKLGEIASAANRVSNCLDTTIDLVKNIPDEAEREKSIDMVFDSALSLAKAMEESSLQFFLKFSTVPNTFGQHCTNLTSIANLFLSLESAIKKHFPEKTDKISSVQKEVFRFINIHIPPKHPMIEQYITISERLGNEIKSVDSSFNEETNTTVRKGCYVATAVYGSYDCPQVWTLRRFRDYTLAETWYGRAFIHTYYAVSPTFVKWFGKTEWFKNLWKPTLDKMVSRLNGKGVADTPYQDKQW